MSLDVNIAKQLNTLYNQSPELRQKRIEQIEQACGPKMAELLRERLGESATRFGKPWAITDTIHDGATIRSDCHGKTKDGRDCGVRATIQAVQDAGRQWVLEGDQINFDRCQNNPCPDCREQCCHGGKQEKRDNV